MSIRMVARILAIVSAVIGALHFHKNRTPSGFALWMPKLLAGALSPYAAVTGAAGAARPRCSSTAITTCLVFSRCLA